MMEIIHIRDYMEGGNMTDWKPISSVPKDKVVILGVDSYDCGWTFDSA